MNNSAEFYKSILDSIFDGVYFVDNDRVITYWNKGAERISGYKADEVIGYKCSDNILMHVTADGKNLCSGTCPLVKSMGHRGYCEEALYLLHKNGHRVPIYVKVMPMLNEQGAVVGAVEVFSENTKQIEMEDKMKKLARMAFYDDVTELANKRYMEMKLNPLVEELKKGFFDFGILMVEVEAERKPGEDCCLPPEAIKTVAKTLAANVQITDTVGRWDDNKFLVLSEHSRKSLLLLLADKLRAMLLQSSYAGEQGEVKIRLSIGGTLARREDSLQDIIQRATKLSNEAKLNSDNGVNID